MSPRLLYFFRQFAGRLLVLNKRFGRGDFRLVEFAYGPRLRGLDAFDGVPVLTDLVAIHSGSLRLSKRERARARTVPVPSLPSRKKFGDAGIDRLGLIGVWRGPVASASRIAPRAASLMANMHEGHGAPRPEPIFAMRVLHQRPSALNDGHLVCY
jgi:hypothetical protein